jgi:hypothetical protein
VVADRSTRSLEGIESVATQSSSGQASIAKLIVGLCTIVLGLFIALAAVVNLPDSWFGVALGIVLVGVGSSLVYLSSRGVRASEPR